MPELPEVETIRAGLESRVTGARIVKVELLWPGCVATPSPEELAAELPGRTIERAGRRGKFLVLDLDAAAALTVHLRMTGRLRIPSESETRGSHLRAALTLDRGDELWFEDQRKFGRLYFTRDARELAGVLAKLGPEPLEASFTRDALAELLMRRRAQLKPLLLDQAFIAGLGNIYVDEALFRARLHPERSARSLSGDEVRRLHRAIRAVLRESLEHRGTTFSSFQDANGEAGAYGSVLAVYGRGGRGRCPRCGHLLEKIVVGGRGTHFCPRCQVNHIEPGPAAPEMTEAATGR